MTHRCRACLLGTLLASCTTGALAATFPPWRHPEPAPPAVPSTGCDHERIGGWVGGTLGGWIVAHMGRRHADHDRDNVPAAAFGAVFGYWLGTEIGRAMDEDNPLCPGARPPRGAASSPLAPRPVTGI